MRPFFNLKIIALLLSLWLSSQQNASAQTLLELWERTQKNEPSLQSAQAQLRAVLERENQAFAQFFPQINLSANTTQNHRDYQQLGPLPSNSKDRYNSHGSQINITQALWKKVNSASYNQATTNALQARLQYLASEQDLMGKLINNWAELFYAKSAWISSSASVALAREQLQIFESGFSRGLYSLGQRDESRAKFEQANADLVVTENEVFAKQLLVEQITGPLPTLGIHLNHHSENRLPFGELSSFETYTDQINTANPAVKAAQLGVEAARRELEKITAQRFGSIDLVASVGRNAQPQTGATPSQSGFKSRQDSIGIQFNLPLYSGGGQTAKEREAVALAEKAQGDLDALTLSIKAQAGQAWAQVRSSYAKATAAQQSLIAAETFLTTARAGQKAGTKTPSDELQANQQKANAQRDLHRAYYDNIIGMSRVQAAIGGLDYQFLVNVEHRHLIPAQPSPAPNLPLRLKMTLTIQQPS